MTFWYNLMITERIHKRSDIPLLHFTHEYSGIVIYIFFPKDGSGKGIVLSNNHDNVSYVIDITLTGISHDRKINRVM